MKTYLTVKLLFIILFALVANIAQAQDTTKTEKMTKQQGHTFVDNDGDGYNDNAPDHDGDGVPNGLDPDWQKMKRKRKGQSQFIDLDGDGINDNLQQDQGKGKQQKFQSLDNENGSSLDNAANQNKGKMNGKGGGKK